jgi:hypothetical protein
MLITTMISKRPPNTRSSFCRKPNMAILLCSYERATVMPKKK